jgi:hypothetical protein
MMATHMFCAAQNHRKAGAGRRQKRQILGEIELEKVARAVRGDFRATYILCPKPRSNWRVEIAEARTHAQADQRRTQQTPAPARELVPT